MKYGGEFSRTLFDHEYPPVSWVGKKYVPIDRSDYKMTGPEIADSILNLRDNKAALILPDRMYYGGKPYKPKKSGISVPLDTSPRFRKFGPTVDIVKTGTTIKGIKEAKLTPRKAFRQALNDPETRESMMAGMYRGFGYWSPRSKRHNVIWFDVPAEGSAYLSLKKAGFSSEYQFADAYQTVPSHAQIDGVRFQGMRVLPVTQRDGWFYVEWLEEAATCACKDSFFMGAGSKKKQDAMFENVYKYANPEQMVCRHNWAQRMLAEEEGEGGEKPLLVKWPRATGFMNPWKKAKTQVYIKDGSSLRRPMKSEVGVFCQYILATLNPEEAFDLSD